MTNDMFTWCWMRSKGEHKVTDAAGTVHQFHRMCLKLMREFMKKP